MAPPAPSEPDKIVALRADDPAFWLEHGQRLLLRRRVDDAHRCFDRALDSAPDDLVVLNAKARSHLHQGELSSALELLEQACAIDSTVAELWNNRGVAQARTGDTEAALESFARALELEPDDASVLCNRAMALVGDGDHERALEDLDAAVQLTPGCLTSWSAKGATHLRLGQLRLARHAFLRAARLSWSQDAPPGSGVALRALAAAIGTTTRLTGRG